MTHNLKVLFLASEADPFIKVGGLGDVAGSLPLALRSLKPDWIQGKNLDVRLVIPFHSAIQQKLTQFEQVAEFEIPHEDGPIAAVAYLTQQYQVPVYLIASSLFPPGEPVYSGDDYRDGLKYCFFSLAALEMCRQVDWIPEILHANDWHTAVSVYTAKYSPDFPEFHDVPSVLTVHNLPYLGVGARAALREFFIPPSDDPDLPDWARLVPLPLGLVSADRVIAVSESYAEEILTPEFGCGLEDYLDTRASTITGILNGLDQEIWDPSHDSSIPQKFDAVHIDARLENRKALLDELQLNPDPTLPLIILISRMDPQKGVDLAIEAFHQIAQYPWQAAILGTGVPLLEANCKHLQESFPDRVRAILRFDSGLARRMYAGADMILMPSRYEPCGLAQMIAMRYGCIPVARATGGLRDTIQDMLSPGATGFLFQEASPKAVADALVRAFKVFTDAKAWQKLQRRGMQMDFSWQRSALAYAHVYQSLKEQIL